MTRWYRKQAKDHLLLGCKFRDRSRGQRVVDAERRDITRESSCRIRPYSNGIVIEPKPDPTIACIMGFIVLIKHTRYVHTTTNDDDCSVEHCMCATSISVIHLGIKRN
jgi:hypothetical protein